MKAHVPIFNSGFKFSVLRGLPPPNSDGQQRAALSRPDFFYSPPPNSPVASDLWKGGFFSASTFRSPPSDDVFGATSQYLLSRRYGSGAPLRWSVLTVAFYQLFSIDLTASKLFFLFAAFPASWAPPAARVCRGPRSALRPRPDPFSRPRLEIDFLRLPSLVFHFPHFEEGYPFTNRPASLPCFLPPHPDQTPPAPLRPLDCLLPLGLE